MNRVEYEGLKISCLDLLGAGIPLVDEEDIRVLVPLGDGDRLHGSHPPAAVDTVVTAPEVWVVPPHLRCELTAYSPARIAVIAIDKALCEREGMEARGVRTQVVDSSVSVDPVLRRFGNVFAAGLRISAPPERAYLESAMRELAQHVALNYGRAAKRGSGGGLSPDRLARALRLIDESLGSSLHVDDIARHVNMSPFHFARMFKVSTGHSPHFYLTTRRVERAKELLEKSPMSLAEIAQAVGFATQAHFTGVFRAYSGTTPRAYRVKVRRRESADE